MYISLFFPEESKYRAPEPSDAPALDPVFDEENFTAAQRNTVLWGLSHRTSDPTVADYRAEFSAELFGSDALRSILTDLSDFCLLTARARTLIGGNGAADHLRMLTLFEGLSARMEQFRKRLDGFLPESAAAKRLWLFLRSYASSFEYRELKTKAADLRRELRMEHGYTLFAGDPQQPEPTILLRKNTASPDGIAALTDRVTGYFSAAPEDPPAPQNRPYTGQEAEIIVRYLAANEKRMRKAREFADQFLASDTDTLLRLGEEAHYFTLADQIYRAFADKGLSPCRPVFREPGQGQEIKGLSYRAGKGTATADLSVSTQNRLTFVFGPDSDAMFDSARLSFRFASAGGLVFAEQAQISLPETLREDSGETLSTRRLNEWGLCICSHLFDMLTPPKEEAATEAIIARLDELSVPGLIRICSRNNLEHIRRKAAGGLLPSCTILEIGTEYTLQDLLTGREDLRKGART